MHCSNCKATEFADCFARSKLPKDVEISGNYVNFCDLHYIITFFNIISLKKCTNIGFFRYMLLESL